MNNFILFLLIPLSFLFRKEPEYVKLSRKIVSKEIEKAKKEKGYIYTGGGGSLFSNVKSITLYFLVNEVSSVAEARRKYVELVEEVLKEYNSNKPIRPYLNNYPFLPKNTDIVMNFNKVAPHQTEPLVDEVKMCGDDIYYFLVSPNSGQETGHYHEPYDEAYRRVYGHDRPEFIGDPED